MRVILIVMIIGDIMMDKGPLEEEGIHDRSERPPDRRDIHDRGYSRRGRPPDDGGPP